ncbi:hypothetical protein MSG28_007544 [Choristoneura fumiferana]|uniref:Uncharacterized protein n=1 Tax=Choristoneura fumiferana TaxID=7141 RepID=A0ACC0JXW5_CHOFU|nr:hypothetical protein MSG28_007544 [Choristoneura fumiferana]
MMIQSKRYFVLYFFFSEVLQSTQAQCSLTACEVLDAVTKGHQRQDSRGQGNCVADLHWRQLDRRLRAIEQPTWTITFGQSRWRQCGRNVCRCDVARRSLNCWRANLATLSADLLVPSDLVTIDLGTNKLRTLHKTTFKGMRSLSELDMFDNHVEYLPAGIFDSLVNLRILRLQRNYLEEIDSETFRSSKKLFHVDLSNNFLYTLPEKLFANNSLLETVDISNNQVIYIPSDSFIGLDSLRVLDLSNNKIQQIENGTFFLRTLRILKFSENRIVNITENAFEDLISLETYLDSNMFPSLPSRTLDYMPKLAIIKLSGNPWHCDCHTLYISALYEENEMAQGLYFAVTFNCADGTNTLPLNFQININDNNNNNPLWKTEGSAASLATTYDFTIATPVAPGFPITDCVRQIIVRDVDLTNYAINFGIEDNPYFEIGYDEASSTVDKEYKATLRTTTFLRSIPGPLVLRISATEPMFSQPLYTATYNENNQVTLEQTISLQQGYDSQVQFSLEGDYAEDHFDIVVNGNEVSLVVTNPMPSASLRQGQIHLIVNAIREYTSGASSAIINLEFERPHYEGEIVDNALQLTQLILRQGYQDSTLTITVEDYPSFFTAATAGNIITLSMTPLNASIIEANNFINLRVTASTDYSAATTIVTLEIIKDDIETPLFGRSLYSGMYDNTTGLTLEPLLLTQGYDDTVQVTFSGEHEDYFELVRNGASSTLRVVGGGLPSNIWSEQRLLLTIVATKPRTVGASTVVSIALPELENLEFEQAHYEGEIVDNTLQLTQLILSHGYQDSTLTVTVEDYSPFFTATTAGNIITLSMTPLNASIIEANNFINLRVTASTDYSAATTIVTLEIIKDDIETPLFGRSLYSGTYDNTTGLTEQRLLFTIVATKPRTVGASTVVSIALPEARELGFEAPSYRGSLQDNILTLEIITLSVGYGDDVTFTLSGDYSSFFSVSSVQNQVTINPPTQLPQEVISENNFLMFTVTADGLNALPTSTAVLLEIIKDDVTTPVFSQAIYYGNYLGSLDIDIGNMNLAQGYDSSVSFRIEGENSQYFQIIQNANSVTLTVLTAIPEDLIFSEKSFVFNIFADKPLTVGANAAIFVRFSQDLTEPALLQFGRHTYIGSVEKNIMSLENIVLESGFAPGTSFHLTGDYSSLFTPTIENNVIYLSLSSELSAEVLENNKFLILELEARRDRAVPVSASIIIDLVEEETPIIPVFNQAFYTGIYTAENILRFEETISLLQGYDETVTFSLEGESSEWFTLVSNGNSVTLVTSSNVPQDVVDTYHQLLFTVIASKPNTINGESAISIDLPKVILEQEVLRFDQSHYEGRVSESDLQVPTILLVNEITDNIELTMSGNHSEYFSISRQLNIIHIELVRNIPAEVISNNEFLIFEISASKADAVRGYTTLILRIDQEPQIISPVFEQAYYSGEYSEQSGLIFEHTLRLIQGYDETVQFALQGDSSEWFILTQTEPNSLTLSTRDGSLQQLENINHLVFSVLANKPGSIPGEAAIIINLSGTIDNNVATIEQMVLNEGYTTAVMFTLHGDLTDAAVLGFERASYLGIIENNAATIEPIVLNEGYTTAVIFTLHGDLSNYFNIVQQGSSVSIVLQAAIPEQSIPANRIVLLELRATSPGAIPAVTAVVFEVVREDDVALEELVFSAPYYTGQFSEAGGLVFETAISLDEGYDQNVQFALDGALYFQPSGFKHNETISDLSNYFNIVQQGSSVSIVLQAAIPEQSIPANRIVLLELRATSPGAIPAVTAVVFEVVREDDVALEELVFSAPYYTGQFSEAGGLVFETAISLDEGYDQNVQFGLDGEHAQWFTLVVQGNSVTLTTSGAIPPAVIANNQQLVFVITAEKPNSNTARATIIISLVDDLSDAAVLGFERASYLGIIENNAATIEPIVLNEGYTTAVIFTLHGDLSNYFNIVQQGSSVSIVLQAAIPEQSIPANRIVLLELRATSPGAIPAVTAVVFEVVRDDDVALEELVFSAPYYTGQFSEAGGLVFETAISLDEGYDQNVQFALDGEHAQWFTLVVQGNSVTLTTSGAIPPAVIANNQQLVFVITADKPNSNTARATIVISLVDDLTDAAVLGFERASYLGIIENNAATIEPIVLNEGYTTAVIFTLHGEHAQWFTLVVQGNLVTLTTSGAIPPAVIANNQQLVFVITAEKPNSNTARATIVISLINGLETETESFGQVLYEGTINVNVVQHESITVTGYTGSTVEILGDYRHLFAASLTEGAVVVAAVGNLALPDDVSHVPLELRAGAAIHLQERVSITGEGEIHLSAPTNTGVYSFEVTATSVITQVQATASVQLTVEVTATCGDDDHALPPLIILDRDEEEPHDNLVVLDSATQSGCTYRLTNRWPPEHDWLYVDENGLHARRIDREDPRIAFMALSQIQVELVLECPSDTQTRVKRSLSTSSRHDLLGPYDYGSNKWILTDTILYNSRRSFVNLIVNDINDNYPVFIGYENEPIVVGYPIPELEEVVLPRALVELKATDADVGENAQLQFWSPEPVLAVASSTGSVHVRDGATLTDEEVLTVSVTDLNGREDGLTTSMELMVKLIDTRHIAVVTVRNAFLDHEDNILSNLTAAVGYEVKVLSSAVISDDTDTSSANARNKREVTSEGASLQLYVYGLIDREPVAVERLSTDISENVAAIDVTSTISLEDHLEGREIPVSAGRDTGLLVATIVLSILLFILIVAIAVRKARNYEQFSDANSLASRNEPLEDLPKVESLKKPRLNLEELKRSERRLQEMLEAPIEDTTVKPSTSDELDPSGAFDTIINMAPPDIPMPIVIQSIDRLKDNATSEDEDEFGERANKSRRKSVVTFNENVEKIIHVEDIPDDNSSDLEIFKF